MDAKKEEILFKRWHTLNLQERCLDQQAPPSQKADLARGLLSQKEYANTIKNV